jgi:hypothetical protein
MEIKRLTAVLGAAALGFCLLFSGCVLYPKDEDSQGENSQNEDSGGFPQEISAVLLSNGASSLDAPPEIVGLDIDPSYSDYTSSDDTFLLSYTGAVQEDFDDYASYLVNKLGAYVDASESNYSCYGWGKGNMGIELGFSSEYIEGIDSVPLIPPYTLYLLIIVF